MTRDARPWITRAVPDASLVVKWYTPHEPGYEHAQTFVTALGAYALTLTAPEHLKVETVRLIQLASATSATQSTRDCSASRLF